MAPDAPADLRDVGDAVSRATGKRVTSCLPLTKTGGYTRALRTVAHFADGSTAFVKAATESDTAGWINREIAVYETLGEKPFLPRYYGSARRAESDFPVLVLEDLTGAHWGPPWRDGDIQKVLDMLAAVRPCASLFAPGFLHSQDADRSALASWNKVAADPEPFLSLGFCSRDWLDTALPTLLRADATAVLGGDDLVHQDVRSDNLCFTDDGRAVLVDWNWACYGNGLVDIAGWLPSLHHEGGPAPETILPDQPELAAILAGYWAAHAGRPSPNFDTAGRIRRVQKLQLSVALPWAVRALGLPGIQPQRAQSF
ncbi:MAG: phosphotransferase [Fibrella sp.]|nr:phosphotransferase [Armatimonadota bacterium]